MLIVRRGLKTRLRVESLELGKKTIGSQNHDDFGWKNEKRIGKEKKGDSKSTK
jgi:hypothetical protein